MLGGLFARHRGSSSHAAPPPPKLVEPPLLPSLEKRQEKERKWMESISNKGKRTAQSSHPPLPVPVEYIRKDQQPGPSTTPTSTGLLDRWTTSPHKRGSTAGSHALHAPSHTTADENRSLRTTRSTSALASRLGGTLKSTIASSGRKSKERDRHRQQSGTSSLLIDHAAAPRTHPTLLRTPPLLQLGGGEDPSFVHVPQLSPSSTLLVPSLPHPRTQHSLDRNIPSAPLTSSLTTPDASQPTPHPRASHIDTAKSLATRLQELEHANNVGLLNDEEYRVLRQNLFQKSVGERKLGNMPTPMPSSLAEGGLSLTPLSVPSGPPGNGVQRTGTLLGLPRLNMAEGDTRVPPPQPVAGPSQLAPTYLPTPSNTSVHSKSRFSLRSSRSGFTARSTVSHMSRLFRRGGSSAPAPNTSSSLFNVPPKEEGGLSPLPLSSAAMIAINSNSSNVIEGNGSVRSIPVSVGRKLGKKGSIPQDWKELQDLHYKETQREEAKARSIRSEKSSRVPRGSKTVSVYIHEEGTEMEQPLVPSSYRTMRRASASANPASPFCSSDNVRASVIHPALSASTTMTPSHSNSSLSSYSKSDLEGKSNAHSGDRCSTRPASLRTARASTIHEVENLSSMPTSSLVIVQPGDEALNSIELREAIASLKEENARLVIQFSDLEASLQEKYGDPALEVIHLSAQQRRRESLSMSYLETGGAGRRLSTSSSLFSASQGRNSMMGQYVAGGGSLQPGSSMVRRPSKTSSIASSSMRRGLNSSGSTHPGSYETHMTSRPPSTVQEELLFEAIDAAIDSEIHPVQMQTHPLKDPQYEKEYQTLQERKKNIEERYAARLEYLEARLKGQLMKEKLRR